MLRTISAATIALLTMLVAWNLFPGTSRQAQAGHHRRTAPDLFYNYYVPPGGSGGVAAQLYPCPRPTPPLVGHTYVTYQPLLPHEFLYRHHRVYWRKNDSGWTRTRVIWH